MTFLKDTEGSSRNNIDGENEYAKDIGSGRCGDEPRTTLLLDLQMPKADGFTVIDKMRENGWMDRNAVLIISGEDSVEVENKIDASNH